MNKGKGVIKLAGMCVPSITSEYMLDDTIQAFYLWDPIKLGYVTYYAAKLMVEGTIEGRAWRFLHDSSRQEVAGHLHDRGYRRRSLPAIRCEYTEANYKEHATSVLRERGAAGGGAHAPLARRMARTSAEPEIGAGLSSVTPVVELRGISKRFGPVGC